MSYRVTDNKDEMDIDAIHDYLSGSYWAENIPKSVLIKAIENSLCFAVLAVDVNSKDKQVGFARLITGLRRMMLATRDAHGLYEQYGFAALTDQKMFMQLWTPDVYTQTS